MSDTPENETRKSKGWGEIKMLLFGGIFTAVGSVLTIGVQAYTNNQLLKEQHLVHLEAEGRKRQIGLVLDMAESHEAFMDADMKFLFASEVVAMKGAFDYVGQLSGKPPNPAIAEALNKQMEALGISPQKAVFSKSSSEYSKAKKELVRRLTEVDLYFSDRVTSQARAYQQHIKSSKSNEELRTDYWVKAIQDITRRPGFTEAQVRMFADAYESALQHLMADQAVTVQLYNNLYYAMRDETRPFM